MIVIIEHGKGTAYPSVWLAKSRHSKAEYNANTKPHFAMYHTGELPPNYPMPAIPQLTFDDYRRRGYVKASVANEGYLVHY